MSFHFFIVPLPLLQGVPYYLGAVRRAYVRRDASVLASLWSLPAPKPKRPCLSPSRWVLGNSLGTISVGADFGLWLLRILAALEADSEFIPVASCFFHRRRLCSYSSSPSYFFFFTGECGPWKQFQSASGAATCSVGALESQNFSVLHFCCWIGPPLLCHRLCRRN